jgi:hypothetical protein
MRALRRHTRRGIGAGAEGRLRRSGVAQVASACIEVLSDSRFSICPAGLLANVRAGILAPPRSGAMTCHNRRAKGAIRTCHSNEGRWR